MIIKILVYYVFMKVENGVGIFSIQVVIFIFIIVVFEDKVGKIFKQVIVLFNSENKLRGWL